MTDPTHRDVIVRYSPRERSNHWIVAIFFILAALSGLALFHPALFWLAHLFGGGPWTRILHPLLGVVMAFAFVFLAALMWRDARMKDRDWQWMRQIKDVVNNRED